MDRTKEIGPCLLRQHLAKEAVEGGSDPVTPLPPIVHSFCTRTRIRPGSDLRSRLVALGPVPLAREPSSKIDPVCGLSETIKASQQQVRDERLMMELNRFLNIRLTQTVA
ncbi:MAG TPA: hypothetical protein VJ816_09365, partial [Gemmatimonadales bacterium]|nr:hypothetical protein [Gemmatimonadales bacterium]